MSKEKIMRALKDEEFKKKLLDELKIEELEERITPIPLCYMPPR